MARSGRGNLRIVGISAGIRNGCFPAYGLNVRVEPIEGRKSFGYEKHWRDLNDKKDHAKGENVLVYSFQDDKTDLGWGENKKLV